MLCMTGLSKESAERNTNGTYRCAIRQQICDVYLFRKGMILTQQHLLPHGFNSHVKRLAPMI